MDVTSVISDDDQTVDDQSGVHPTREDKLPIRDNTGGTFNVEPGKSEETNRVASGTPGCCDIDPVIYRDSFGNLKARMNLSSHDPMLEPAEFDDDDDDGRITQIDIDAEMHRWAEKMQNAAIQCMQSGDPIAAGSVPAGLQLAIDNIVAPKVSWKVLLHNFCSSIIQPKYSFKRQSRRSVPGKFVLPGYYNRGSAIDIAVALDTSGSVVCDPGSLEAFLSELRGVMSAFGAYNIHVMCFDGEVDPESYKVMKDTDGAIDVNLNKYMTENLRGGGGTRFTSVWDFMKENNIRPRGLLFFTDGYPCDTAWESMGSYCPALFMTVGNGCGWKAPFGTTIEYEKQ